MRGPRMYGPSKIRYQPGAVQRLFQMRKELPGRRHQREDQRAVCDRRFKMHQVRCLRERLRVRRDPYRSIGGKRHEIYDNQQSESRV